MQKNELTTKKNGGQHLKSMLPAKEHQTNSKKTNDDTNLKKRPMEDSDEEEMPRKMFSPNAKRVRNRKTRRLRLIEDSEDEDETPTSATVSRLSRKRKNDRSIEEPGDENDDQPREVKVVKVVKVIKKRRKKWKKTNEDAGCNCDEMSQSKHDIKDQEPLNGAIRGTYVRIRDNMSSLQRRIKLEDDNGHMLVVNAVVAEAKQKDKEKSLLANGPCDHKGSCEVCGKSFYTGDPKDVLATECLHLLCKRCIMKVKLDNKCPVCNFSVVGRKLKLIRYLKNRDNDAFKAVECINMETGEVLATYCSASAASVAVAKEATRRGQALSKSAGEIINACRSKCKDGRKYAGFYWKFFGSKERILKIGEGVKDGIPIEQIDPATMTIIKAFTSSRKASEKTGIARCSIRRVLSKAGNPLAGGFFWRYEGENHGPWEAPKPKRSRPVEKLCPKTGDILEKFENLAAAKKTMNARPNDGHIRQVCMALRQNAYGFFWRWKGSRAMPNKMKTNSITIQLLRTKNGPVVKEYTNSRLAGKDFGVCYSTICRWCREQCNECGYYWRYKYNNKKASQEEQLVGKRLRVHVPHDDSWVEGHIGGFDFQTKKHIIVYDKGDVEQVNLKDIQYEWKVDQGQKTIEQLDLETGQVIAVFDSVTAATKAMGGTDNIVSRISAVCKGHYKSAHGYFWRYKGSTALPSKKKGRRPVQQLNLKTGAVVATYETITEAGKALGITSPGISYCCNGRHNSKSAGGYGWRFAPEG